LQCTFIFQKLAISLSKKGSCDKDVQYKKESKIFPIILVLPKKKIEPEDELLHLNFNHFCLRFGGSLENLIEQLNVL
jgi:hypothetical protein